MPVFSASSGSFSSSSEGFRNESRPCGNYVVGGFGIRVLGGAGFLICCALAILILRKRDTGMRNESAMAAPSTSTTSEKDDGYRYHPEKQATQSRNFEYPDSQTQPPLSSSQEPTLFETNLTNVRNLQSIPSPPPSTNSSTYPVPPSPGSQLEEGTSSSTATAELKIHIPRRRSYTKTIVSGGAEIVEVEVNGEIVVSPDGWRRHTRVFGGGVCKACEESERRLSA